MGVTLSIGPLPSAGAIEFLTTAKEVVDKVRRAQVEELTLPDEVGDAFEGFLDEWLDLARSGPTFHYEAELDETALGHLVAYWFHLIGVISGRSDELGLPLAGPEAEPFYHSLVDAVTSALGQVDDREHLGERARDAWPGITDGARPAPPAVATPARLVVVDDSEDIRLLLRIALGRDPRFEVVGEAADGAEAVEIAARVEPDLVLLDLEMPVMDGFTALPAIVGQRPETKVIIHSALPRSSVWSRCESLGAVGYIEKSTSLADLADALAAA